MCSEESRNMKRYRALYITIKSAPRMGHFL